MVIMNIKTYEEKLERIEMYEAILEGLKDQEKGNVKNGQEALKEIRRKYGL